MSRFATALPWCGPLFVALLGVVPAGAFAAEPDSGPDTLLEQVLDPTERTTAERQADQEELIEEHCRDDQERPATWLDRSHSYVSELLCEPAAWFDGFFGDPRSFEETPVGTFIRVRNSVHWDETDGWSHGFRVRASLLLPRVSERFRLLVTRDEDFTGELRDGPALGDGTDRTRLGLRFIARERVRQQFDIDASIGIDGGGLNPEVRGRYRYVHGLTDQTLARATQSVFWQRQDGFGTTSRLDWEWLRSRDELLRWTAQGTVSQESEGVDWRTSVIAFRQLNPRTALRGEVGTVGWTKPSFEVEEYFVALRFRRQFFRSWLYYELQPEHAWPLDLETGQRRSDWRFTFTLEVQFENKGSRHERLRAYLGDDIDPEAWDETLPVPEEAPGERAKDPVLEKPDSN